VIRAMLDWLAQNPRDVVLFFCGLVPVLWIAFFFENRHHGFVRRAFWWQILAPVIVLFTAYPVKLLAGRAASTLYCFAALLAPTLAAMVWVAVRHARSAPPTAADSDPAG
jgi:hypothetical protein